SSPVIFHGVSSVAFGGFDPITRTLDILASTGRGEPALVYSVPMVQIGQYNSDPRTRIYAPVRDTKGLPLLFSQIIFDPLNVVGLGVVLQDGAQIGGVVAGQSS